MLDNLSEGGLSFFSQFLYSKGDELEVRFLNAPINLEAKVEVLYVERQKEGQMRYGCRFLENIS